jgi:glycosyltransferase involved in cell wall biosynthesis
VQLLQELGHEVHVFQSEHYYWQEEHLNNVHIYVAHPAEAPKSSNRLIVTWPAFFEARVDRPFSVAVARWAQQANASRPRSAELVRVLQRLLPEIVFSLKMQNDGYTVCEARALMGKEFVAPWVHFVWGTDIEFFAKNKDYAAAHSPRIRGVLESCDFVIADTERDARQVFEFGFKGRLLGVAVAFGGFDFDLVDRIRRNAPRNRDVILIKARQGGLVGKALNVLQVIESMPDRLRGFRIVLIMSTAEVAQHVASLDRSLGVRYEMPEKLPYQELLALFARARLAVSATDVDGAPAFLLEAMAMGALPVHSDMESVREWVTQGESALLFPVDDRNALREAITRGLNDDLLCVRAAEVNYETVRQRAHRDKMRGIVRAWLEDISDRNRSGYQTSTMQSQSVE